MLELLDRVLRSSPFGLELQNFLLNSLVLEALGHKFAHKQLLLFNEVLELL
jgi:hypothetical protein